MESTPLPRDADAGTETMARLISTETPPPDKASWTGAMTRRSTLLGGLLAWLFSQ